MCEGEIIRGHGWMQEAQLRSYDNSPAKDDGGSNGGDKKWPWPDPTQVL